MVAKVCHGEAGLGGAHVFFWSFAANGIDFGFHQPIGSNEPFDLYKCASWLHFCKTLTMSFCCGLPIGCIREHNARTYDVFFRSAKLFDG